MNKEFQGNWQFPDQEVMTQAVPVKFKNISMKVKTFLEKPSLDPNATLLQLNSKKLEAEIQMSEVSVDTIVEREVSGVVGRFRIQASCKNVLLSLNPGQGNFSMMISPSLENSTAGTRLQSVNISWLPGSWTAQGMQCEGAQGFETVIRDEIAKIANDSARFVEPQKELIKKYVEDYLAGYQFDFSQSRQLVVARPDIKVTLKVEEYKDVANQGAVVKGRLVIDFLQAADSEVKVLNLSQEEALVDATVASIRLPKDFIKEVVGHAYSANSWLHKVTSDTLPGFSNVMASRFAQWFVWPELMSYSRYDKFLFSVYSSKDVTVDGSGMSYQVKGTFLSKMQAPKGSQYVPFMNFAIPLTSKVTLKVENSKAQATFVNPVMGLTPYWEPSYINKYGANRKFKASTIRDKIVGGLWGKTVSVAIPNIPLTEGLSLKVKKVLSTSSQDLVLELNP
ncbi:hypothetical protein ACES2L_08315 [Bdellovibrio bacteriovorus]